MRQGEIAVGSDGVTGLDLGEDWDASIREAEADRDGRLAMPSRSFDAPSSSERLAGGAGALGGEPGGWAIVLFTYTGDNHRETAAVAAARLRAIGTEFATVRPYTDSNGSMVLYGRYTGRDDPAVREDLNRLRSVVGPDGTRRAFPRVMLTYIEPQRVTYHPHDLRSVRQEFGPERTLYTLDVAVWSTFGDEKIDYADLKGDAEAYCRQLRAAGFEAYYYHNERSETSGVTVGVFGPGVVDAQTGIYSEEVMRLVDELPSRRTNGEPLEVPIDRFHPSRGTRPQSPVLVEVPE